MVRAASLVYISLSTRIDRLLPTFFWCISVTSFTTLDWTLIIITSRFTSVHQVLTDNEYLLGLANFIYTFAFVYVCVYFSLGKHSLGVHDYTVM